MVSDVRSLCKSSCSNRWISKVASFYPDLIHKFWHADNEGQTRERETPRLNHPARQSAGLSSRNRKRDGGQGENKRERQSLHVGRDCGAGRCAVKVGQSSARQTNLLSQFTGEEREAESLTPRGANAPVSCFNVPFSSHTRACNHGNVQFVAKAAHPFNPPCWCSRWRPVHTGDQADGPRSHQWI